MPWAVPPTESPINRNGSRVVVAEIPFLRPGFPTNPSAPHFSSIESKVVMHILYVEDNKETARAMQMLLGQNGHEVEIASTSAQATAICIERAFDLWIVDIGLPDGHGGDLLRTLRRMSETKAIAVTGHGLPYEIAEGRDDGFDAYLTKPTTEAQLLETIARL
jgi:DNA-binding response OmpR family regulator